MGVETPEAGSFSRRHGGVFGGLRIDSEVMGLEHELM